MLGGADNPNGELLSYIIGADNSASSLNYNAERDVFTPQLAFEV